jgi:hypothetical protein
MWSTIAKPPTLTHTRTKWQHMQASIQIKFNNKTPKKKKTHKFE